MMSAATPKRNYFNLVIGVAFLGYGGYRVFTFLNGAEYSAFRIIVALGFILLGAFDLYKFYKGKTITENED
jgi:hypothetical protein